MDDAPRAVRTLMRLSLVLDADHHNDHHTAPFDRNYCITTGWWNPFLRQWRIFERAETCIQFLTGVRPSETASGQIEPGNPEQDAEWETGYP
jgi:ubiquitin-conjugating enzyme E2 variant